MNNPCIKLNICKHGTFLSIYMNKGRRQRAPSSFHYLSGNFSKYVIVLLDAFTCSTCNKNVKCRQFKGPTDTKLYWNCNCTDRMCLILDRGIYCFKPAISYVKHFTIYSLKIYWNFPYKSKVNGVSVIDFIFFKWLIFTV